jgi:hypothetical protein
MADSAISAVPQELRERALELARLLDYHGRRYHVLDDP